MNPVVVRGVAIGEGIPKICAPIVGVSMKEIIAEAVSMQNLPVDVVEWRADWFEKVSDFSKVRETLEELRRVLGETPLLFTFRTSKEGGEKSINADAYQELNQKAAETGLADLIDVEIFRGDTVVSEIIRTVHRNGRRALASSHNFHKTPNRDEIVARLRKMQDMGADILKVAVMPEKKADVIALLDATRIMSEKYAEQPIVTISMGAAGAISRLSGEVFGSALTFGAAKKASAPGQMGVCELSEMLRMLHGSLS